MTHLNYLLEAMLARHGFDEWLKTIPFQIIAGLVFALVVFLSTMLIFDRLTPTLEYRLWGTSHKRRL